MAPGSGDATPSTSTTASTIKTHKNQQRKCISLRFHINPQCQDSMLICNELEGNNAEKGNDNHSMLKNP